MGFMDEIKKIIHPYDDELVIAGQGSIGLEILDQLPQLAGFCLLSYS